MAAEIAGVNTGGLLRIDITGGASTANAGLGAIANPEGVPLLITRGVLRYKTASTGAANLSIGIAADNASAATDLINALAANGVSANDCYNCHARQNTAKTAIAVPVLWTATKFLTITGSATTAGMTAELFIEYIRLDS